MPDLSRPVGVEIIVASIAFILLCVGAGLAAVAFFKNKSKRKGES